MNRAERRAQEFIINSYHTKEEGIARTFVGKMRQGVEGEHCSTGPSHCVVEGGCFVAQNQCSIASSEQCRPAAAPISD